MKQQPAPLPAACANRGIASLLDAIADGKKLTSVHREELLALAARWKGAFEAKPAKQEETVRRLLERKQKLSDAFKIIKTEFAGMPDFVANMLFLSLEFDIGLDLQHKYPLTGVHDCVLKCLTEMISRWEVNSPHIKTSNHSPLYDLVIMNRLWHFNTLELAKIFQKIHGPKSVNQDEEGPFAYAFRAFHSYAAGTAPSGYDVRAFVRPAAKALKILNKADLIKLDIRKLLAEDDQRASRVASTRQIKQLCDKVEDLEKAAAEEMYGSKNLSA